MLAKRITKDTFASIVTPIGQMGRAAPNSSDFDSDYVDPDLDILDPECHPVRGIRTAFLEQEGLFELGGDTSSSEDDFLFCVGGGMEQRVFQMELCPLMHPLYHTYILHMIRTLVLKLIERFSWSYSLLAEVGCWHHLKVLTKKFSGQP